MPYKVSVRNEGMVPIPEDMLKETGLHVGQYVWLNYAQIFPKRLHVRWRSTIDADRQIAMPRHMWRSMHVKPGTKLKLDFDSSDGSIEIRHRAF